MGNSITNAAYGTMPDGTPVERYTLANASGASVDILTYGGVIASIRVPDRYGWTANVTLGMGNLDDYRTKSSHFGAITGRYANRIAGGSFTLDGTTYPLEKNNGPNALHGGRNALDKQVWSASVEGGSLVLRHTSPDGDQGYPGTLELTVTYGWSDANELRIDYAATTDKPTVLNLTNHAYFNLAGEGMGSAMGHQLLLAASHYTPVDANLIPTSEIAPVAGTPFDFSTPTRIGERLRVAHPQMVPSRGYDHNFVIDKAASGALALAARVREQRTGRVMECLTTEPGVQLYAGNSLDGKHIGPSGRMYMQGDAFCLETQHFPDSPNRPEFPTTVLRPGEKFASTTVYAFSTDRD